MGESWAELSLSVPLQWAISQDPPKHRESGTLTLGLLLRPEGLTSVLELGPEADQPEVRSTGVYGVIWPCLGKPSMGTGRSGVDYPLATCI